VKTGHAELGSAATCSVPDAVAIVKEAISKNKQLIGSLENGKEEASDAEVKQMEPDSECRKGERLCDYDSMKAWSMAQGVSGVVTARSIFVPSDDRKLTASGGTCSPEAGDIKDNTQFSNKTCPLVVWSEEEAKLNKAKCVPAWDREEDDEQFAKRWCSGTVQRDAEQGRVDASGCFGDRKFYKDRAYDTKDSVAGAVSNRAKIDSARGALSMLTCASARCFQDGVCKEGCIDGVYQSQISEPITRKRLVLLNNYLLNAVGQIVSLGCYWTNPTNLRGTTNKVDGKSFPVEELTKYRSNGDVAKEVYLLAEFYFKNAFTQDSIKQRQPSDIKGSKRKRKNNSDSKGSSDSDRKASKRKGKSKVARRKKLGEDASVLGRSQGLPMLGNQLKNTVINFLKKHLKSYMEKNSARDLYDEVVLKLIGPLRNGNITSAIHTFWRIAKQGRLIEVLSTSLVPKLFLSGVMQATNVKQKIVTTKDEILRSLGFYTYECRNWQRLTSTSSPSLVFTDQSWVVDGPKGFVKTGQMKSFTVYAVKADIRWWQQMLVEMEWRYRKKVGVCDDVQRRDRKRVGTYKVRTMKPTESAAPPGAPPCFKTWRYPGGKKSKGFKNILGSVMMKLPIGAPNYCINQKQNECLLVPKEVKDEDGNVTFGYDHDYMRWDGVTFDNAAKAHCVAKFEITLDRCSTCCCHGGVVESGVDSVLILNDSLDCRSWFSALADSTVRFTVSFIRSSIMTRYLSTPCYGA